MVFIVLATEGLGGLDEELDNRAQRLLPNLEDPTTKSHLDPPKPEPKKLVNGFIKKRALPDEID